MLLSMLQEQNAGSGCYPLEELWTRRAETDERRSAIATATMLLMTLIRHVQS